jgi:hypothetical protein
MKYFMIGGSNERLPSNMRIFSKLGQYFGWTSDAAYIVDYSAGVEFFLSAVIYSNSKHIAADNEEEYKAIAKPFMAQLGKAFYEYELKRKKAITPHIEYIGLINSDDEPILKKTEPSKKSEIKEKPIVKKKSVHKKTTHKSIGTKSNIPSQSPSTKKPSTQNKSISILKKINK